MISGRSIATVLERGSGHVLNLRPVGLLAGVAAGMAGGGIGLYQATKAGGGSEDARSSAALGGAIIGGLAGGWLGWEAMSLLARGMHATGGRMLLNDIDDMIAILNRAPSDQSELVASTRDILDRNKARIEAGNTLRFDSAFTNYPDYDELGEARANTDFLEVLASG